MRAANEFAANAMALQPLLDGQVGQVSAVAVIRQRARDADNFAIDAAR